MLSYVLIVAGATVILSPLLGWAYSQYAQARLAGRFAEPGAAHAGVDAGPAAGSADAAADPAGSTPGEPGPPPEPAADGTDNPAAGGAPGEAGDTENPVFELPDDAQAFAPAAASGDVDWPTPLELDHTAGFPAMRLEIPKLSVKAVIVSDVNPRDLKQGPGHYPMTPFPGEMGNSALAGHRTTYGAWFRNLHKLEAGDTIRVVYGDVTVAYAVEKVFVVPRTQWTVVAPTSYPALTLTTCDPPGSDRQRLVVRARLVEVARAGG